MAHAPGSAGQHQPWQTPYFTSRVTVLPLIFLRTGDPNEDESDAITLTDGRRRLILQRTRSHRMGEGTHGAWHEEIISQNNFSVYC